MKTIQEQIFDELIVNKEYKRICQLYGGEEWEDLYNELFLVVNQSLKKDSLKDIYERGHLLFYLCSTIKNMAIQPTSPYYRKNKQYNDVTIELTPMYNNTYKEDIIIAHKPLKSIVEEIEVMTNKINRYFERRLKADKYYFYHKQLFEMYYYDNMTLQAINNVTKISITNINYSIQATIKDLKENNLFKEINFK